MSVINKMLSDLDNRQEEGEAKEDVAFLKPKHTPAKKWPIFVAVGVLTTVLVALAGYWFVLKNQPEVVVVNDPRLQQPESNEVTGQPKAQVETKTAAVVEQPQLIIIPKVVNQTNAKSAKPTLTVKAAVVTAEPKTAGPKTAEPKTAGPKTAEPKTAGPKTAGPKTAGPKTAEPKTAEPKTAEPKTAESKTAEPAIVKSPVIVAAEDEVVSPPTKPVANKMQVKAIEFSVQQRTDKTFSEAKKLARKGLIKQAIAQYQQVLQLMPVHDAARVELAALYFGREKVAKALVVLNEGLAIESDNISWSRLAAKIHYQQQNYAAALQYLQLPVITEQQIEYVALKATSLQRLKQFSAAAAEFRRLVTVNPTNGRWWLGLATSLEAAGDKTSALVAYRKSLEMSNISSNSRQFVMSRLRSLAP